MHCKFFLEFHCPLKFSIVILFFLRNQLYFIERKYYNISCVFSLQPHIISHSFGFTKTNGSNTTLLPKLIRFLLIRIKLTQYLTLILIHYSKKKKKKFLHPLHQISQSFLKVFSTFCKIKHFFSNKFITLTYIHKFTQMYTPSELFSLKVLSFLDI